MKKDTVNKKFVFEIKLKLKEGILDPQGNVTYDILKKLNYPVEQVNFDKSIRLTINESNLQRANEIAEEIASNVLVNPVLEYYQIFQIQEE
ncbi:MAG TPA: phosphoribosylformylglycinamidine synthase subunit PurS [Defluviitoga sp.]|nr:phosphoribosylformylglycinamidine synthase subunit PurS [Defluviitoga sp.]HOP23969.1 phosphoribosylformylglycinamidine synthase subunit PurS [Defluviitoga sp.]HPZ28904.1 phosphoribosylformylglycinamidine synthase subunit PurS [Defluviitoga sp.]HQD62290.1 phosphoribosylformylglycinamidine synthase subunit PurS [Defluviitoga sp.]